MNCKDRRLGEGRLREISGKGENEEQSRTVRREGDTRRKRKDRQIKREDR